MELKRLTDVQIKYSAQRIDDPTDLEEDNCSQLHDNNGRIEGEIPSEVWARAVASIKSGLGHMDEAEYKKTLKEELANLVLREVRVSFLRFKR